MLKPINDHVLIEPVQHEGGVIATHKTSYEEIGIVLDVAPELMLRFRTPEGAQPSIIGAKVYFDSWLAAKYPVEGKQDEFYWLVKWEDVRAIEYGKSEVSE